MITIFTTTKPFIGHNNIIQTNAILSWLRLKGKVEVIVFGNDKGTSSFCRKYNIKHIPKVKTNKYGTPLISSMFELAEKNAEHPILAYVNADIILLDDFVDSVAYLNNNFLKYMIIGQRTDLDVKELIDWHSIKNRNEFQKLLNSTGQLHGATGTDYFVFPKEFWGTIPDFAIGRASWDNWLIYRARELGAVIDATNSITAVHQNHDYFHLPKGLAGKRFQIEAKVNADLAGKKLMLVDDASFRYNNGVITKVFTLNKTVKRKFEPIISSSIYQFFISIKQKIQSNLH